VDPPLAEGLAQGVFWAQYRVENVRIVQVFGPGAVDVSPRIGHLHIMTTGYPRKRIAGWSRSETTAARHLRKMPLERIGGYRANQPRRPLVGWLKKKRIAAWSRSEKKRPDTGAAELRHRA